MAVNCNSGRTLFTVCRSLYPNFRSLSRAVYINRPFISAPTAPFKSAGIFSPKLTRMSEAVKPTRAYSTVSGTKWEIDLLPAAVPMPMSALSDKLEDFKGDALFFGVYSEDLEVTKGEEKDTVVALSGTLKALDNITAGAVSDILEKGDFKGNVGDSATVRVGGNMKNLSLYGLGKKEAAKAVAEWGKSCFEKMGDKAADTYKSLKATNIGFSFTEAPKEDVALVVQKIIRGLSMGAHKDKRYKERKNGVVNLESISFVGYGSSEEIAEGGKAGISFSRGSGFTRYLVESPPNVCSPQYLADAAQFIADTFPEYFTLKIMEKEECEKMGMGCFLGVAQASDIPPKFIHLTYTRGDKANVALVGKGITFDSGGYNLKSSGGMIEKMKFDMGGCGAVLGAAYIIGALAPEGITVHFISASCENMVSGNGYRPGDIIKAMNGKSVEVINTDAEGRLTLADALLYAQNECKAKSIIDIATLTGACMVALGSDIAGLMSPNENIIQEISSASKRAGEKVWRLPLEDEYMEDYKSGIADLKNVGTSFGGAVTAGGFLKEFVKIDEVEWAHLDIAGPVYNDKKGGATGFGATLLAEWVLSKK